MTTLEEPWCSGLGAEPRPGPGYMRPSLGHDDRETEDPSNISSGLTAFACVSLSPGVQQEPPSRAAYQPQTLEQAWRGSQEGGVLARSLTLAPPAAVTRLVSGAGAQGGPAACVTGLDQGYNANIVLCGTREVFIQAPASSKALGDHPEQRLWERKP